MIISMKKLAVLGFAFALLVQTAVPAFAAEAEEDIFGDESVWHWQKTDAQYLGPTKDYEVSGPIGITANHGQNDKDMVYSFEVIQKYNASGKPLHNCRGEVSWINVNYYDGIEDYYEPGETSMPHINFRCNYDRKHTPGDVVCSISLADIGEGNDPFGQKVTVKDHFYKGGSRPDPSLKMDHFMRNDETMDSKKGWDSKYGTAEYDFYPAAEFPEGKKEGEKLYIVLDVTDDHGGDVLFRSYWEYTWVNAPKEAYAAPIPWQHEETRKKPNPFYEQDRP